MTFFERIVNLDILQISSQNQKIQAYLIILSIIIVLIFWFIQNRRLNKVSEAYKREIKYLELAWHFIEAKRQYNFVLFNKHTTEGWLEQTNPVDIQNLEDITYYSLFPNEREIIDLLIKEEFLQKNVIIK